jgi:hypothetical protein
MSDLAGRHFTVHRDSEIDSQIRGDVEFLRGEILAAFPDARALFLVGGFGRGEGGIVKRDGRWRPSNDYDFELITPRAVDHATLHALGERLAGELSIPFVHVENSVAWKQRLRGPTEYTVDLRLGSLALHDPHRMRDRLRRCRPDRIPLSDALMTLFTRSSALLWHFEWGRDWARAPEEDRHALAGQISKALLAIMDAWVIRARQYHPSYAERQRRLESLSPGDELIEDVRWATEVKLRPDTAPIPDDLAALWFRTRDLHQAEVFRHAGVMALRALRSVRWLRAKLQRQRGEAQAMADGISRDWSALSESLRCENQSLGGQLRLMRRGRAASWKRHVHLALVNMQALAILNPDGTCDPDVLRHLHHRCACLGEATTGDDWESLRQALNRHFPRHW